MNDIALTPDQVGQFKEALRDAFRHDDLDQVVYLGFGVRLDDIVSNTTYDNQVKELVMWANSQNLVGLLLAKARSKNPDNIKLRDLEPVLSTGIQHTTVAPSPNGQPIRGSMPITPEFVVSSPERVVPNRYGTWTDERLLNDIEANSSIEDHDRYKMSEVLNARLALKLAAEKSQLIQMEMKKAELDQEGKFVPRQLRDGIMAKKKEISHLVSLLARTKVMQL